MRIASFDIGKKNLAFYVEDCFIEDLNALELKYNKIKKKDRRKKGGVLNMNVQKILTDMFTKATHVPGGYGVFDIREYDDNILDIHVRANLQHLMEKYMWLWQTCDVICIEQQFFNPRAKSKGGGANMDAIKIGECLFSWFVDNFYTFKVIEYFGSQYKTQLLGAPHRIQDANGIWKPMTKKDRKEWSVAKAEEIFLLRRETEIATMFCNAKKGNRKRGTHKMDDIADCIMQCQAYKFKRIIAKADYS